ncbi:tumor necrosis factor receptor superfamily member 17 [Lepisosteus oculatus]|uniref:tumor necrosis factor receptor superfamily member 17 n=1 Tax=Lepisosteus oculatus TaxID=7918 RepID=UPI0035F50731
MPGSPERFIKPGSSSPAEQVETRSTAPPPSVASPPPSSPPPAAAPLLNMDKHKCSPNDYYDKLMETCKPCYLRCSKAPPSVCLTYCKQSVETVWIILGAFLLLGAVGVILTVSLQKLWKRRSSRYPQNTGGDPEKTADAGRADSARETGLPDGLVPTPGDTDRRGTTADLQRISALPLPATEEGATLLVTAKTTQLSSYPWDGPRDVVGLRRSVFTA